MNLSHNIIKSGENLTNNEFVKHACDKLNHVYQNSENVLRLTHLLDRGQPREKILAYISQDKWKWSSDISLISIHIPKTAGSTLLNYIRNQYSPRSVLTHYGDWRDAQRANNNIQAIHGHIIANNFWVKNHNAKKITWLREPMMRLISQYYYWKSTASPEVASPFVREVLNGLPFEEYIDHNYCKNSYTNRWLKGIDMEMFDFIGIVEKFHTDIHRMGKTLKWKPIKILKKRNQNIHKNYSDIVNRLLQNKKLVDKIKENNEHDYEIYYKYGGVSEAITL
jgi:hypothetical protein